MSNDQYVQFIDVKKSYDQSNLVVKNFNLDIKKGEFVTLLGPSGSGKTTCLMMLAGFEDVTSGNILIDGQQVTNVAPYDRNIGVVFQHYALFPHMTIGENLAYPLKVRKLPKDEVDQRVAETLALVELNGFENRYPAQLSGGQKQRVAVARALIFEPKIVLMDEPLGALDKNLREQMQLEIKRLHEKLGFTAVYVTHDQTEALTMSDRIAVFDDGIVQQCALSAELYEKPSNLFVANFIGENNNIPATLQSLEGEIATLILGDGSQVCAHNGDCVNGSTNECVVTIRPENFFISQCGSEKENTVTATYTMQLYVGDTIYFYFSLGCQTEVWVKSLNDHDAPHFMKGETVTLSWTTDRATAFVKKL